MISQSAAGGNRKWKKKLAFSPHFSDPAPGAVEKQPGISCAPP
jgi:hypothetical protein